MQRRNAGQEGTPVSLEFGRAKETGKMAKFKLTLFRGQVSERTSGGYGGGMGWPEVGQGSGIGFTNSDVPFGANGVQVTHLPAGCPRILSMYSCACEHMPTLC